MKIISAMIVGAFSLTLAAAGDTKPDAARIIDRMESLMRGDSSYAEMTMRIERPRYQRSRAGQSSALLL